MMIFRDKENASRTLERIYAFMRWKWGDSVHPPTYFEILTKFSELESDMDADTMCRSSGRLSVVRTRDDQSMILYALSSHSYDAWIERCEEMELPDPPEVKEES